LFSDDISTGRGFTYYVCSKEAYDKKDAIRVLKYQLSRDQRSGGSVMLVKKSGTFGLWSKWPKGLDGVDYRSDMLNELNTKEELSKNKDLSVNYTKS
jgi:hypothetical protein